MGGAIPVKNLYNAIEGIQPSGERNSIPPNAEFCSVGIPPNAKIAIEYVTDPNVMDVKAIEYYLYMVSAEGCSACESAKPVLDEFRDRGKYHVTVVEPTYEKYDKLVESLSINQFPTFIWGYYDNLHQIHILNRWSGTENLEARLKNGLTFVQADPESFTDEENETEENETPPKEVPSDDSAEPIEDTSLPDDVAAPETFGGDLNVTDDFDSSTFAAQGYGNQDAEPLLREYGNGWRPNTPRQPESRQTPRRRPWACPETEPQSPSPQDDSGLVPRLDERVILPRILSPLMEKVEAFFDKTHLGILAMVKRGIAWTVFGAVLMIVTTFYVGFGLSRLLNRKKGGTK